MPRIVAIANEKGGAGKTTTAINLAAALAEVGERVLVVDFDARADLTLNLGLRLAPGQASVYSLFADPGVAPGDVLCRVGETELWIAPAERDLAAVEVLLQETAPAERGRRVGRVLKALGRGFGWVFVDCPPGLSRLVVAVLECVDQVIVPQQASFTALHGLRALEETLADLQRAGARRPPIIDIVLTMTNRTIHSREVEETVRGRFGDTVLQATIPQTVRLQEAPQFALPITSYDPASRGAEAYRELAQEVLKRAT